MNKLYQIYLTTKEWKKKADDCKKLADYKCVKCSSVKNLHAHHLTYDRIGEELQSDLQCLCLTCHEKEHGKTFMETTTYTNTGKGGWRKMYLQYDEIILGMNSKLETRLMLEIRDLFTKHKIVANINQKKLAKQFSTTPSTVNRLIKKLGILKFIHKIDRGVYMMNPYIILPYQANAKEWQDEWDKLKENK